MTVVWLRSLRVAALASLAQGSLALAQLPPPDTPVPPFPVPPSTPVPSAPAPPTGVARWFNPSTAPFIPVPEIGTDPNSGTTVGLLPVWLRTDQDHDIDQIIAPDISRNPYFGWGTHARLYAYPSADEQWSGVAGIKERVERDLDLEYQTGRARRARWTFSVSLVYDRDGTPRFYGIGNGTPEAAETNYTANQQYARAQIGFNISKIWQLAYTVRVRQVDVLPGTLSGVESIQQRFGDEILGTKREFINRLSVIYDTRDDPTIPSHGMQWIAYGGLAGGGSGWFDSLYTETGVDGRAFWQVPYDTVLAAHVAVRYLLSANNAPFWTLSSVGGALSDIGGEQPLRGFGAGRFTDRDGFSTTLELRHRLLSFDAASTHVDVEVAPFVDAGRVFADSGTFPLEHLHPVGGVGFRGIARPFVVGYVDLGWGSEGIAVFTGINYPF
jgi:hypothetical protein